VGYPKLKENELLASRLDYEKIGSHLITTALSSNHLGHNNIPGVFDYVEYEQGEDLELEYVHDMFTKTTPEIIDKWFGGSINAMIILQKGIKNNVTKRLY
jgi:hypothetical protein